MIDPDANTAVDKLLGAEDGLAEREPLRAIVEQPMSGLVECARARWAECSGDGRRLLIWLLERLRTPEADATLIQWFSSSTERDDIYLLRAANGRQLRIPPENLDRMLGSQDHGVLEYAIAAAGYSGDVRWAPIVATFLDNPRHRRTAALALGALGAEDYIPALIERLQQSRGLDYSGFVVALEMMGDKSVVPELQKILLRSRDEDVGELAHALWKLSGFDPVIDASRGVRHAARQVRRVWARQTVVSDSPCIRDLRQRDENTLDFVLENGKCSIYIDFDPPTLGSAWPRWYRSLYVQCKPLYCVGSCCETCETRLVLAGWQPRDATVAAYAVRETLEDMSSISEMTIRSLTPVVHALRSGRYLAVLADLGLESIGDRDRARSWWVRRTEMRGAEDYQVREWQLEPSWPSTRHYQLREPIPGNTNSFGYVLPSQDLGRLDASTLQSFSEAIQKGRRPAAIALSWVETKWIEGDYEERSLVVILLDGHHKTESYCRLGVPARMILLCRVEDTWGPPNDRAKPFLQAVRNLRGPVS